MKLTREKLLETFPQIQRIQSEDIREKVIAIWQEVFEQSEWQDAVAPRFNLLTPKIPLVYHTYYVTEGAMELAASHEKRYGTKVDYDVLIASCILHDVSKLIEMAPGGAAGAHHTEIGNTYQHAFFSAYYAKLHDLPDSIVTTVLTHTGFSKTLPSTLEGIFLFYADMADSDIQRFKVGAPLHIAHHK